VQPKQETFFDAHMMPEENWAYIVEQRVPDSIADEARLFKGWVIVDRPNHFRTGEKALTRLRGLEERWKETIAKGFLELRVVPKYVGYVPPEDEVWIS
jgi:hypothetical protein